MEDFAIPGLIANQSQAMKTLTTCICLLVGACAVNLPPGTTIGIQTDHGVISIQK